MQSLKMFKNSLLVDHVKGRWKVLVAFIIFWWAKEHRRTILELAHLDDIATVALRQAIVEAVKLALSTLLWLLRKRHGTLRHVKDYGNKYEEEEYSLGRLEDSSESVPLSSGANGEGSGGSYHRHRQTPLPIPRTLSIVLVLVASFLFTSLTYTTFLTERISDVFTLYLALSGSTLFAILGSYVFLSGIVEITLVQSALIQFCGLFIVEASVISKVIPSSYPTLIGLAFSSAAVYTIIAHIYTLHHQISLEFLHIMFFAVSLVMHLISFGSHQSIKTVLESQIQRKSSVDAWQCVFQVGLDVLTLVVIYFYDPVTLSVLGSFGAASYLLFSSGTHTASLIAGCCLAIVGFVMYFVRIQRSDNCSDRPTPKRRTTIGLIIVSAFILLITEYVAVTSGWSISRANSATSPQDLANSVNNTCPRKPLLSTTTSFYPHERVYHAFDDVLVVVFFSHARYGANLDYYKAVYAEFFPNIVFVGPASREDAGFEHSYDVLVDTYESDEDLNDPTYYKMAGRMAHHMLYTAMGEHPCYSGYLWAPFDTLLNVPRLQQFNQSLFWYHSPFGEYVRNIAVDGEGPLAGGAPESSRHAPPANISPDPAVNWTETWKGWGPDWWWGEPHVGLEVCMKAFNNISLPLRQNLAAKTEGLTRLIGGSADTLYIPGRYRETFMEVLGTFLKTNCFLEIATPTTVHLVVDPGEPILFVDHWWIWTPPFNATFVRMKWEEGMEVDTFHTFHWGDKGDDGVWKGNPEHIQDVRRLLAESSVRQKVEFPTRVDGGEDVT